MNALERVFKKRNEIINPIEEREKKKEMMKLSKCFLVRVSFVL